MSDPILTPFRHFVEIIGELFFKASLAVLPANIGTCVAAMIGRDDPVIQGFCIAVIFCLFNGGFRITDYSKAEIVINVILPRVIHEPL